MQPVLVRPGAPSPPKPLPQPQFLPPAQADRSPDSSWLGDEAEESDDEAHALTPPLSQVGALSAGTALSLPQDHGEGTASEQDWPLSRITPDSVPELLNTALVLYSWRVANSMRTVGRMGCAV